MSEVKPLIERLENPDHYVDAVDDAITKLQEQQAEIERLHQRLEKWEKLADGRYIDGEAVMRDLENLIDKEAEYLPRIAELEAENERSVETMRRVYLALKHGQSELQRKNLIEEVEIYIWD